MRIVSGVLGMDDPSTVAAILFTDIEGSTRLWEHEPERMRPALARHDALARSAVESHRGTVVKMTGDGLYAAFGDALDAVEATLQLQQALADPDATNGVALRVRSGLHAGVVERRDDDYFGSVVNRAARIMGAAHGGQVLLSQAIADRICERLPSGVSLRDLGAVRLRDLAHPERVYQVLHPRLRQDFPALRSLESTPNNLPQQISSFIGREREQDELERLLATTRLVTLAGVGGLGKTRLSLQTAADVMDDYVDGVWFVDLAPLSDPRLVVQAVASVLMVKDEPERALQDLLAKHLKDRQVLLILDNCEHLLSACADLAKQLLQAGPRVKVLATSREPLHVTGETAYPMAPLTIPESQSPVTLKALTQYESVRLFADRAAAARPDFQVTAGNAKAVAEICRRLDGIPLALELAAARVRALSVDKIAARLTDRFRLLTDADRTALSRQQTLRACLDWSYELLTQNERILLQRIAVFAGGWTLEAVESVGVGGDISEIDVLDLLSGLVDKSLVLFEPRGERYRLLETVRQYARERLNESGEEDSVHRAHFDYFYALAEEADPFLRGGSHQKRWLDLLELEHDNVRASLAWTLENPKRAASGLRMCGMFYRFWMLRGYLREANSWCTNALRRAPTGCDEAALASALLAAGTIGFYLGNADARALLDDAITASRNVGDRRLEAAALNNLANLLGQSGELVRAQALLEQARAINRDLRNTSWEIINLTTLSDVLLRQGDYAGASALCEDALALSRKGGDRFQEAGALGQSGYVARARGDNALAEALMNEALTIYRELAVPVFAAEPLVGLAELALIRGNTTAAADYLRDALELLRKAGEAFTRAWCLEVMGALAVSTHAYANAARIWGASTRLRRRISAPASRFATECIAPYRAECRHALGDAAYDAAEGAGHALDDDVVIGEAIAWLQTCIEAPAEQRRT